MTSMPQTGVRGALTIQRYTRPNADIARLLGQTVWGDRGFRYRVTTSQAGLQNPHTTFYLCLYRGSTPIGVYGFSRRQVQILGTACTAVYRTGFAIDKAYSGAGHGTFFARAAKRYLEETASDACLSYGFVDSQNLRSVRILQAVPYQTVGAFEPVVLYRHRPVARTTVRSLGRAARQAWSAQLQCAYRDHALVSSAQVTENGEIFVAEAGQGRTVSVGVRMVELRLESPGGLWAWLLRLAGIVPVLRKHVAGASLRFLTFEGLQMGPGGEAACWDMLESLLHEYQVHLGLFFLDPRSPVYRRLKASGRLGLVDRLYRAHPVYVMVGRLGRHAGWPLRDMTRSPLYIAAADVI